MQQEPGGLHHFAIHAPGRKRGGAGEGAWPERGEGETALPAGSQPPPSSPRCSHLCTPQGVWGLRPKGSGAPLPTPQMRSLRIQEGGVAGQAQPQGPQGLAFREPGPCPAGVLDPEDPGRGCGCQAQPRGPRGPVDPELSSVSDWEGNGPDLRTKGTL